MVPRQRPSRIFGRIGLVDHIIVQAGPLAAPGEWLSEAPHLVRAILDDRVRIRGLPRHKGVISAVRAIEEAPLERRKKLWWIVRRGLGLYDPDTLRDEAIRVGLLSTATSHPPPMDPRLNDADQLSLFDFLNDDHNLHGSTRLAPSERNTSRR